MRPPTSVLRPLPSALCLLLLWAASARAAQYAVTLWEENGSGGITPRTVTLTSGQALVAGVSGQLTATDVATQAELNSAVSGLLSSLPAGRTVVVDAANGNDGTGTRARLDKPFATPSAAKAAAQSGDVVLVLPGAYTTTASLAKNGVNWRFLPGASVAWATTAPGGIFDDGGTSMTFRVEGGTFTKTQDDSNNALIHVEGTASDVTVVGATLDISAVGGGNQACLFQQGGTVLLKDCVLTAEYDGIIAAGGTPGFVRFRGERLTVTSASSCLEGGGDDVALIDCDLTATGPDTVTDGVSGDIVLDGCRSISAANGHNQEVGSLTLRHSSTVAAGPYALQGFEGEVICLQGAYLEAAGSGGSIVQGAPTLKILGTATGNGTYGSAELDGGTWLNIASGATTATGTLSGWTFNGAIGTSLSLVDAADFRAKAGLTIGTHVQAYDADLTDLADGFLTGSKVGPGIDAGNITTGTLAVANGGTGVTTSTGTGSVVLSASPALSGMVGVGGFSGSMYAAQQGVFLAGRSAQNTGAIFYNDASDNVYLYAELGAGKTLTLGDSTRPFRITAGWTGISHGSGETRLWVPASGTLQLGIASATPSTHTLNGQSGSGTNITGGTLNISAGPGTGSAASGDIVFKTHATGGASGTTAGTPVTRMTIAANGVATFGSTVVAPEQRITPGTAPAAPATGWTIYCDSGDGNKLKAINSTGTIVTLGTP